jgi:hypothetical protein
MRFVETVNEVKLDIVMQKNTTNGSRDLRKLKTKINENL